MSVGHYPARIDAAAMLAPKLLDWLKISLTEWTLIRIDGTSHRDREEGLEWKERMPCIKFHAKQIVTIHREEEA